MALFRKTKAVVATASEPVLEAYIIRMIKPGQLRSMVYNTFGGLVDAEAKGVWYTENWVGWSVFDIKLAPVQPRG